MCLGIPGKIESIDKEDTQMIMGEVSFGGFKKKICLAFVPEAVIGDYVVVHVGFAISKIDEKEALRVFSYLEEMGELEEIEAANEIY